MLGQLVKRLVLVALQVAVGLPIAALLAAILVVKALKDGSFSLRLKGASRPEKLHEFARGWGESMTLRFDGMEIHAVSRGQGPLMLCLHGFPECWYSWRYQMQALSDRYRVVAIDLRGYGLSKKPLGVDNYHVTRLADDIPRVIEQLGSEKCVLMGHDWGGIIAWNVASRYPEKIERLIIMQAPHPMALRTQKNPLIALRFIYTFFLSLPYLPELLFRLFDASFVDLNYYGVPHVSAEDRRVFKEYSAAPNALHSMFNYYRSMVKTSAGLSASNKRQKSGPKPSSHISAPTLVIWGDKDPILTVDMIRGTDRFVSDLTVKLMPGANHWVNQFSHHEVNAVVREWLSQRQTAAPANK